MRIGVLALQGAFREHRSCLRQLGVETIDVRYPHELSGLDGLVIPGGESTAIAKLLASHSLYEPIRNAYENGMAIFGTCAGAILLAKKIEGAREDQIPLGLLNVTIKRNAYGRQIASFETDVPFRGIEGEPVRAIFIRAPRFADLGPDVEVLSERDGEPTAVREGRLLAIAYHPELTGDLRVHKYFIDQVIGS
ncbi:MAG: pyridoxal 5'-phosphate synthase glutaminase subunit PdxT [Actinobacteria bacterium]|nr:pyridoxal 5'-phosphate synthase glutaminase subunit PdxT [Actinomycetota bacterium]